MAPPGRVARGDPLLGVGGELRAPQGHRNCASASSQLSGCLTRRGRRAPWGSLCIVLRTNKDPGTRVRTRLAQPGTAPLTFNRTQGLHLVGTDLQLQAQAERPGLPRVWHLDGQRLAVSRSTGAQCYLNEARARKNFNCPEGAPLMSPLSRAFYRRWEGGPGVVKI